MTDPSPATILPIDQAERDRFSQDAARNFSVIAPAGTGKTRAIVERIVHIARSGPVGVASPLSRLVVVTYTIKAAEEMRFRAHNELVAKGVGIEAVSLLRSAFFGTIHSFCGDLLRRFGPSAGLPSDFEIVEDDQALWQEYFAGNDSFINFLPDEAQKHLMRHIPLPRILELARSYRLPSEGIEGRPITKFPNPQLDPLLNFEPSDKRALRGIAEGKDIARAWLVEWETGTGYLPLPDFSKGGKVFQVLWKSSFQPLRDWLGTASLALIGEIANQYRKFRIASGCLTYDDLIDLAGVLVRDEQSGPKIRAAGYRILLDEAQDTDARQFEVLTEVARPSVAHGFWLETGMEPPEPGRFCMVGDPQQSIYSSRADLTTYHRIHKSLVESGAAEDLVFTVTFRCSESVVAAVNNFFPHILKGGGEDNRQAQASFVPLSARTGADRGQVSRINLGVPGDFDSRSEQELAHAFAEWFQSQPLEMFQAGDFSEVAILCPRNEWLRTLHGALSGRGIETQLHSGSHAWGDNPAFLWFTALLTVISQPENSFEIYGVLREIFGISDHDLAVYSQKQRFQILHSAGGDDIVSKTLADLANLRREMDGRTLRDAACHLVETICLKNRLSLLSDKEEGKFSGLIEELLAAAARAENERLSLEEWAISLAGQYNRRSAAGAIKKGHLQLLSCHLSKGLEWDAVILPYFHRQVGYGRFTYPALRQAGAGDNPRLALDSQHQLGDLQRREKEVRSRELERLLYVAATRARRSLILIDDHKFISRPAHSLAEKLQILPDGENTKAWLELPGALKRATDGATLEPTAPTVIPPVEKLEAAIFEKAQALSEKFIRRILPSSLAHWEAAPASRNEPEPLLGHEFPEESLAFDGAAYGNWWHDMMETTPWRENPEIWKNHFHNSLSYCPDAERGAKEIKRFLLSDIANKLARHGWAILTEIPFLWQADKTTAYEGIIDLAALETTRGNWLIVDWKTDRFEQGDKDWQETLKNRYGKQVGIYRQAVQSIFGLKEVETFLYSTPNGSSHALL